MTLHVIDWFAGIDWGSERHQVCILNCSGEIVAEHNFPHTGNGLAEMGRWLANFTAETRNMAVAIEVPHGPVVDLLLDRGFVVYAINPKQLDRLRDRFSIAGSKDDRRDALVAASSLRTDSHLFRRVQASDPARSLRCRIQQPTDLTRRSRFWPFSATGHTPYRSRRPLRYANRITDLPFCEELHGHSRGKLLQLSDSKDSAFK